MSNDKFAGPITLPTSEERARRKADQRAEREEAAKARHLNLNERLVSLNEQMVLFDVRMFWLSTVLALAAVAGAGIAAWQSYLARLSADAAIASAATAKVSVETGQRAWVGVNSLGAFRHEPGQPVVLGVTIENFGATPALDVRHHLMLTPVKAGKSFRPIFTATNLGVASTTALFPRGKYEASLVSSWVLTPQITDEISKKVAILYFYGEIRYRDVFGVDHTSTFCGMIRPDLSGLTICDGHTTLN